MDSIERASFLDEIIFSSILMLLNPLLSLLLIPKAIAPIVITVLGIVTVVKPFCSKALAPISVTLYVTPPLVTVAGISTTVPPATS